MGKTRITSMAAFAGIESLRYLYMQQTPIRSLSGVEELTRLERISLSGVADGDLSPLLDLPQLKEAHLDAALREAAKADLKRARFDVIVP